MLRTIIFAAIIAGTLAGIVFTAIQHIQVIPLIHQAESYEAISDINQAPKHAYSGHSHEHQPVQSTNEKNLERNLFTLLANISAGIGFAMLLACVITLSQHNGWLKGLGWGIAGYLCFFVAPGLVLIPKLPGTLGAALEYQQLWWVTTVIASSLGLGLIVFAKHIILKILGAGFIIMPYVIGAPLPEVPYSLAPEALRQQFVIASAVANAGFWIVLGLLSGYLLRNKEQESHA